MHKLNGYGLWTELITWRSDGGNSERTEIGSLCIFPFVVRIRISMWNIEWIGALLRSDFWMKDQTIKSYINIFCVNGSVWRWFEAKRIASKFIQCICRNNDVKFEKILTATKWNKLAIKMTPLLRQWHENREMKCNAMEWVKNLILFCCALGNNATASIQSRSSVPGIWRLHKLHLDAVLQCSAQCPNNGCLTLAAVTMTEHNRIKTLRHIHFIYEN